MSKWHKVEIKWTKEIGREIIEDEMLPLIPNSINVTLKPKFYQELNCQDRVKAIIHRRKQIYKLVLKFKNEQDAMAFRLKWE